MVWLPTNLLSILKSGSKGVLLAVCSFFESVFSVTSNMINIWFLSVQACRMGSVMTVVQLWFVSFWFVDK